LTVAKYWKEWSDPRLIVLVLHNNDLNQVTWEMRALAGDPKFEASQQLPDCDYAAFAEMIGLQGLRMDDPDHVAHRWHEAFSANRPVVVDAITDPTVPPLPPHTTWKEAKSMVSAILKGDPDSGDIIRKSFQGKIKEFTTS
jgi:pyruvate dehydrogenase (quinone)